MFELRCTVRNCCQLLRLDRDGLVCGAGHRFDRAKQGYWPLVQPQDRKSLKAGDTDEAVLARQRWLGRGYATGLLKTLRPMVELDLRNSAEAPRTLDLGCGEGTFGPALFKNEAEGYCGVDLSKRAIRLASRSWPDATWVLANADRELPAADATVDRVVSWFGRRPVREIARVLLPQGTCVIAVPHPDDLMELREQAQQQAVRRDRAEMIIEEMEASGMRLSKQVVWTERHQLDASAIRDAMSMTYRAVRHSQQARLQEVETMEVTLAAQLLRFQKTA